VACGGCSQPGLDQVAAQCYGCLQTVPPTSAFACSRLGQVRSGHA
jgi:hypothetical protein